MPLHHLTPLEFKPKSTFTSNMFPCFAPSSSARSLLVNFYSRRLLLNTLHHSSIGSPSPITGPNAHDHDHTLDSTSQNSFNANVVMILAVLLCALICALGLNSIVRCALRCSSRVNSEQAAIRRANTGVKKAALKTFPTLTYTPHLNLPGLDSECVICLSEFEQGEHVKVLPKCNHGFHIRCIDKWLMSHSSCPTCRQCLLNTCQKIVGCTQDWPSNPQHIISPLDHEAALINYSREACNQAGSSDPQQTISPLDHEGVLINYRNVC